ncbi:MAG: hypothetical protein WAO21_02065 [Verrucomicrobiia bacterium]
MKIIITSLVSLLVGVGVGWYFGYTRPIAQAARELHQEADDYELSAAAAATFAVDATTCIDSGDTQKAVQFLSLPIAHYCVVFTHHPSTDEGQLKLRARIDELARTNQVVAAQITKEMDIK